MPALTIPGLIALVAAFGVISALLVAIGRESNQRVDELEDDRRGTLNAHLADRIAETVAEAAAIRETSGEDAIEDDASLYATALEAVLDKRKRRGLRQVLSRSAEPRQWIQTAEKAFFKWYLPLAALSVVLGGLAVALSRSATDAAPIVTVLERFLLGAVLYAALAISTAFASHWRIWRTYHEYRSL